MGAVLQGKSVGLGGMCEVRGRVGDCAGLGVVCELGEDSASEGVA